MNNATPRAIALRIAIVVSVIVTIICAIVLWLNNAFKISALLILFSITFAVSYILISRAIEVFIYNKIKLIYKNIHHFQLSPDFKDQMFDMDKDIFKEVTEDVIQWGKENKKEIKRLKELELYRREFIGNLSHELKTPIFNIQGYVLTLLEGALEDPNINRKYLERANISVERMIHLVKDMETITKLEADNLQLNITKVNLVKLAQEVIEELDMKAKNSSISLSIKNKPDSPIFVKADKEKIRQVFTNLLINSIKYGTPGGKTEVKFFDMDENYLIEVSDNGIGIAEEHLPRLFERFYRVDKHRSRDEGGTGLGLSIVKKILFAHKKKISVRSTEGVGTTFSFTLDKA